MPRWLKADKFCDTFCKGLALGTENGYELGVRLTDSYLMYKSGRQIETYEVARALLELT